MQWHQLDHMQTICTSLLTDDHTNTYPIGLGVGLGLEKMVLLRSLLAW